jgi:hypothetical protein
MKNLINKLFKLFTGIFSSPPKPEEKPSPKKPEDDNSPPDSIYPLW